MRTTKILVFLALSLTIGLLGCTKEQKVEGPKQERIEKSLVPPKVEVTGQNFSVNLSDLKVAMTVDATSKEIVETPKLSGNIKITNRSQNILDIQGVTLEYLDEAGKSIAFSSGEKISKVSSYWKVIKPGEVFEGSVDATIPKAAVKEKALGKIEISAVYVPSPLKRETFTIPEKVE
jgi:hypothetical protein